MTATGYANPSDLTRVAKAGDTMQGPLLLSEDPVQLLEAATKEYVDAHGGGGGSGTVKSINNVTPDTSGNVVLTAPAVGALAAASNLTDLTSAAAARVALGLGSAAVLPSSALLSSALNLSDLTNPAAARTSLGLGSAAVAATSAFLQPGNNLSEITSAPQARSNLGLTVLATSSFSILASDYQPIGLANAGASSSAARSDHTHPWWPWQFPVTNYGAKGTGQIDNTAAVSSGSNVINVNTSRFTSANIGDLVMLKDAVTTQFVSGQSTATGTISAVNSPTSITASFSAAVPVSSGLLMWADDDTAAFQTAWNNATAYASAHGYAEVVVPVPSAGLYYGIGPTLQSTDGTNAVYNSSVYIPVVPERSMGVNVAMKGMGDSGWTRYWSTDYPFVNASTIVSFGLFTSALNQSNSVNNRGNPAVFGGPTGRFGYGNGTPQPLYSNIGVDFENITILTPHSTAGWTYGVGNFYGVARFGARNFSYGTTGLVQIYNSNSGDFNNVTLLSGGISIGLLLPSNGNNARNYLNNVYCNGGYTYGLVAMEHTVANGLTILYCWSGLCPCGNYADSGAGGGFSAVSALHASWYDQVCIEACTYHVNIFGAGQSAIGPIVHATLDTEGTVQMRDNPNNGTGLAAARGEIRMAGAPSNINLTFPTGLRIIKEQNLPGVISAPPALVANTAVMNSWWRPVTVYLKGGTGLTTVQVSNLAGGTSAAMSNLADLTSAGTIPASAAPFPVRLGPGQWLQVNIAGAGSALPSATWVSD